MTTISKIFYDTYGTSYPFKGMTLPTKFIDGSSRTFDGSGETMPALQPGDTPASVEAALSQMGEDDKSKWIRLRGRWPFVMLEGMVWRAWLAGTWGDPASPGGVPESVLRDACSQYGVQAWEIRSDRLRDVGGWLKTHIQMGKVVPYDWSPQLSTQRVNLQQPGVLPPDVSSYYFWNSTDGSSTAANFAVPTIMGRQLVEDQTPIAGNAGGYSEARVTT